MDESFLYSSEEFVKLLTNRKKNCTMEDELFKNNGKLNIGWKGMQEWKYAWRKTF
ncbi:hypothetical protein [Oceanobacillus alkalisoli]|uniref:hypothetical protein n=1 Tax=Oceanobacillus alkalisoli TaxID=2925113 RepID=UPI001EE41DED|nr:hypothetical protein [Oceanobacillus alkalisoli]MCG5102859.1 hypothetical protein [Oceanobacillus alkalisoli]